MNFIKIWKRKSNQPYYRACEGKQLFFGLIVTNLHIVLMGLCIDHRYIQEIPEPAPSWFQHGGSNWGPSRNQHNRGSSGAYVTSIYCCLSVKINICKRLHGVQRSFTHLYCVCFCLYGRQNPENFQFGPNGWRRHYTWRYRTSGISRCISMA